jgi:hypothetical protein
MLKSWGISESDAVDYGPDNQMKNAGARKKSMVSAVEGTRFGD